VAADWIARLNSEFGRMSVGGGRLDLLHWAYDAHLKDNQPHRHTHFEACLVGAYGEGTFTALGEDHPLTPGTFFIARPGVVHQIRNTQPELMELFWVSFAWAEDEGTPKSERLMHRFALAEAVAAPDEGERLRTIWEALKIVAPVGINEQVRGLIQALILTMAQTIVPSLTPPQRPDRNAQIIKQAVRYIEDNLNRPLTVDEIADHVHVSPRHFSRLFNAFAETSPAQFVLIARLDRAIALLERSDVPIKEIADGLGFGDAAYFTRCFTKRFGVAPAAYRRREGSVRIVQPPGNLI